MKTTTKTKVRKGINCPLNYDERRKFKYTIEAANRLRHWLFEVSNKYQNSDDGCKEAVKMCIDATHLQHSMEEFEKLYL
jgi:hypothetical protein